MIYIFSYTLSKLVSIRSFAAIFDVTELTSRTLHLAPVIFNEYKCIMDQEL